DTCELVRMGRITLSVEDERAWEDRSLALRWRLESERAPLIPPCHRQVDEALETKAARQASFNCRLDDLQREESERQGQPDRTFSFALPRSEQLQSQAGIGQKFAQPAVGISEGFDEDDARVSRHRAGIELRIIRCLKDLALAIR